MEDPEPGGDAQRQAQKKALIILAVLIPLLLAAIGYLAGSMLGWWASRDWLLIVAAVVMAGVIGLGRLWNK